MENLKFFTRESAWSVFRSKLMWILDVIGIVFIVLAIARDFEYGYILGFAVLLVSLIYTTALVMKKRYTRYYFFDDHIVRRTGIINRHEDNFAFLGVLEVNIVQNWYQRIFNYGTVNIDFMGRFEGAYSIDRKPLKNVISPMKLKKYLETRLAKEDEMAKVVI